MRRRAGSELQHFAQEQDQRYMARSSSRTSSHLLISMHAPHPTTEATNGSHDRHGDDRGRTALARHAPSAGKGKDTSQKEGEEETTNIRGGWSRGGVGGNLREGRGPRTLPHTQPHRPHPHFPRLHHQRAPRLRPNLVPKSCKPFLDLAAMCSTETQRQAVQRVLAQQRRKAVRADWVLKTDLSGSI